MKPGKTGLTRLIHAARYSGKGFRFAWRNEAAFRQELLLGALLIPLAFRVGNTPAEVSLLIGTWFLVLVTELLNTAVEAVVDRIGPEHHRLAGHAKDLGSAAVAASLLMALAIWIIVLCGGG
ncbi:MAG: diacylglycerol kinase [Ectothiorhodospiraceae bacterium]